MTNEFQKITHLPFSLFLDGNRFKKEKADLFEFKRYVEGISYNFKAILSSDFGQCKPEDLLNQFSFRERPQCTVGGLDRLMIAYVDTDILRKELLDKGIFAEIDGKIVHGPNGYFGPSEYAKKLWEYRKASFFS